MKVSLKKQILKRDDHRCRFCGVSGGDELTIDHVIPTSRGGHPTKKANLVTACLKCNQRKANMTPQEAGMPILAVGFAYTPPGRLHDNVGAPTTLVVVNNYSRRKMKKKLRKERKEIVKRLIKEGKL